MARYCTAHRHWLWREEKGPSWVHKASLIIYRPASTPEEGIIIATRINVDTKQTHGACLSSAKASSAWCWCLLTGGRGERERAPQRKPRSRPPAGYHGSSLAVNPGLAGPTMRVLAPHSTRSEGLMEVRGGGWRWRGVGWGWGAVWE